MRTSQEIANIITNEIRNKGSSINKMLSDCSLSKKVIDNMKTGSMPSADKLAKIAGYLGISTDELLGSDEPTPPAPPSRSGIIVKLNSGDKFADLEDLPKEEQDKIMEYYHMIVAKYKLGKKP